MIILTHYMMTGVTSGAGTAHPSGALSLRPVLVGFVVLDL